MKDLIIGIGPKITGYQLVNPDKLKSKKWENEYANLVKDSVITCDKDGTPTLWSKMKNQSIKEKAPISKLAYNDWD